MQQDLRIRLGQAGEREALEKLQMRASLALERYREVILSDPHAVEVPAQHLESGSTIVACRNGEVKGFAVVLSRHDGDSDLDGLFVDPELWRGGIGRRLIGAAANLARSRGARVLCVTADPEAAPFYKSCGFAEVGEGDSRFGRARLMRLPIVKSGSN